MPFTKENARSVVHTVHVIKQTRFAANASIADIFLSLLKSAGINYDFMMFTLAHTQIFRGM